MGRGNMEPGDQLVRAAWTREAETEMQIHEGSRVFVGSNANKDLLMGHEGKENSRKPAAVETGGQTLVGSDKFGSYGNFRWPDRHIFL